jgi:hypothetical protein
MSEEWDLPNIEVLRPEGQNWLMNLLHACSEDQRVKTLMTLWRIWHAHNELTHDKPCPPIEGSRRFLVSYLDSLLLIKQSPDADIVKGKMVIDQQRGFQRDSRTENRRQEAKQRWLPPPSGHAKLNVDGAYSADGRAGIGMVLRDCQGKVVFTACRQVLNCQDALEAELLAIEEGAKLALLWTPMNFIVESDCLVGINWIKQSSPNGSAHAFRINAIRDLLRERENKLVKISRDANTASHVLAQLGRVQGKTEMSLGAPLPEIADIIVTDCNPAV